jgi:hypothetical protein
MSDYRVDQALSFQLAKISLRTLSIESFILERQATTVVEKSVSAEEK